MKKQENCVKVKRKEIYNKDKKKLGDNEKFYTILVAHLESEEQMALSYCCRKIIMFSRALQKVQTCCNPCRRT